MIKLEPYSPAYERQTLYRVYQFFGFHKSLVNSDPEDAYAEDDPDLLGILGHWLEHPNALYIIIHEDKSIGFIRICYRGPIVAWIEDIFIDTDRRGQGFASAAIKEIEKIIREKPEYTAVCMDVSPRNYDALKLYHKLGFIDISLITVRKELGESKRDKPINLLGLDFNY